MNAPPDATTPILYRTDDGCQWHVLPPWQFVLLTPSGLPLSQWLADGRAQLVRQRAGRAIYMICLGDHTFYLKCQHGIGPVRALADLVRGSAARREWNHTLEARRRGLWTARPIAFAERCPHRWSGESYIITEAIDGAEPVDRLVLERIESLPPAHRQPLRRRALDRLAQFVAAAHEAGLRHRDFHAGNLLAVADELGDANRPGIYLVDLAGASFSGPLDWPGSRANLIVLHAEWFDRLTVAERWRFLRTYLKHRPGLQVPPRDELVDQLDRGARAHSRRIDRRRDRRAAQTNRDFLALRRPGRRFHAVRELPEMVLQRFLARPESVLRKALDRPVKISHTTLMVRAEWPWGDGTIGVALKRCRPRNVWKALLGRFRRSRGLRGWRLGHALLSRRIATPRPLAVCAAPRESYLAVEWLEDAENLHLWAWRWGQRAAAERLRQASQCATSLGRLLGQMHSRHISHRDLKAGNLLVADGPGELRTWLVDTDSVRIGRWLSARRRAADLARLATSIEAHPWVSRTVRYRFLHAYASQFPRGSVDERSLWRAIARRSRRQIARKKRRGRPIL